MVSPRAAGAAGRRPPTAFQMTFVAKDINRRGMVLLREVLHLPPRSCHRQGRNSGRRGRFSVLAGADTAGANGDGGLGKCKGEGKWGDTGCGKDLSDGRACVAFQIVCV